MILPRYTNNKQYNVVLPTVLSYHAIKPSCLSRYELVAMETIVKDALFNDVDLMDIVIVGQTWSHLLHRGNSTWRM